jgi:hypothetical protein
MATAMVAAEARLYHHPLGAGTHIITQGFGENKEYYRKNLGLPNGHNGEDYKTVKGQCDYAARDGVVTRAEEDTTGYGWVVYIQHEDGWVTRYAHHASLLVRVGWFVKAGTMIGYCDSTGFSTGNHLHFEIRNKKNVAVDPHPLIIEYGNEQFIPAPIDNHTEEVEVTLPTKFAYTIDSPRIRFGPGRDYGFNQSMPSGVVVGIYEVAEITSDEVWVRISAHGQPELWLAMRYKDQGELLKWIP